jgi:DNA polymerase III epsilon subunit-like protein
MRWTEQPIFFIDFEGSRATGVLEYGVVTLLGDRVTDAQGRLGAATGRIQPEDTRVHGLAEEALSGAAPFSAVWEVFAGRRQAGPLAAHYASAENSLLKAVWPYPRPSPDFARPGAEVAEWGPWIDSGRIYAQLYPKIDSGRLESLVAACGLQAELEALAGVHCPPARRRYHAALYDAIAGALLLGSLTRHPQLASLTVMQLLALSTLDPGKRDAIVQRDLF